MEQSELQALQAVMRDTQAKVHIMYNALMGNEIGKDGGLVGRIVNLEVKVEKLEVNHQILSERHTKLGIYQKIMWTLGGGLISAIAAYFFHK